MARVTAFDWTIIGVVALSALLAFARGVTRELIALAAWVIGIVAAIALTPIVGAMLPEFGGPEALRYLLAFIVILIAALVIGALIAWPLSSLIRKAGLGFVDRFLGALFGVVRGFVLVLAFALVAGVTALPRYDWWQNAALSPALVAAALSTRPWLPREWAGALDYSRQGGVAPPGAAPEKA